MNDAQRDADLVAGALSGGAESVRALVDALAPVVHARVARALLRSPTGRRQGRDLRQDVEDFVQEVFASLFANGARALRAWDPARGLSLANFVGLVAEHQAASILRSGRRSPWTDEPTHGDELERSAGTVTASDERIHSRQVLREIHERLRAELSPRGYRFFELLVVEERTVEDVCARTGMTADAVYAWRSRIGKVARRIAAEVGHERVSEPSRSSRMNNEGEEGRAP